MQRFRVSFMLLTVPFLTKAGNVVTDWNAIASTTIVKNGGKASTPSGVWFAYTSLAMYDAVNAITGQYRPFYYQGAGASNASLDAAAAAAAHRILVNYFPSQQSDLDAKFASSLANIGADAGARDAGVAAGESAAAAVIAARNGDGLEADVPYVPGSGPGAWVPTPPAFAPPLAPWLGQMRPFTMTTPADHLPDGPTTLDGEQWKRDFNLVRIYGGANSTVRSPEEREIGLFWTEHTGQQYARAFGYLADTYGLGVPDTVRLMAILWTGYADAVVGCFNAKYKFGFWRPITAIAAGGGNAALLADGAWLPVGTTPNHPEYPAAHGCITGAVSTLIAGYFGTTKVYVVTDSLAFPDGVHKHIFYDTRDLMDEVFWARMYAGFHYYHSLVDGRQLGSAVARELLQNHFGPHGGDSEARENRPRN